VVLFSLLLLLLLRGSVLVLDDEYESTSTKREPLCLKEMESHCNIHELGHPIGRNRRVKKDIGVPRREREREREREEGDKRVVSR
jgi:hypothetical protein